MEFPIVLSIKAKNYKSFGEVSLEGFDGLDLINVIIGRNNSGKSALLDLVRYTVSPSDISSLGHKSKLPEVYVTKPLAEGEIGRVFPQNQSGGMLSSHSNFFEYGKQWIGKPITLHLQPNQTTFVNVDPPFETDQIKNEFGNKLAGQFVNPLNGKQYRRLLADRNVRPEGDGSPSMTEDGQGATNVIQNFINKANRDRSLVEINLLTALNEIFNPDASFKRILVRQIEGGAWEIYLEEENKGLVSLSNSGSGLKTIILVLINILLMPILEGRNLGDYIFAFEELENNLHPGLQRRLLTYLRRIAEDKGCCIILTTHSNVIIDLFSKDEKAQIIHVTHNGEYATAKRVKTYVENRGILDDLDVRASDLLQANGIVWLEGPSDRLYFNRWIELWTEGAIKEGTHYQCVFYGGRLLAHLSARSSEQQETIDILNVNKNALLLIDSDKLSATSAINTTKQRIIKEIESVGGFSWVTKGKEIENYIPAVVVKSVLQLEAVAQVGQYEKFNEYLNTLKENEGEAYLSNKVFFAEKILPNLTKEQLQGILDLDEKMVAAVTEIKKWNNLS
jgi:hypothetical protein